MSKLKNIFYLFLPITLGILVSIIIKNHIDYEYLIKPLLSPPKILFPIMWTILYLLMGISYFLYKNNTIDNSITKIYYVQLFLNLIWPILFFPLILRLTALIDIIILDILIIIMQTRLFKRYKLSFYLLIPYTLWCLFATYLNYSIYILN